MKFYKYLILIVLLGWVAVLPNSIFAEEMPLPDGENTESSEYDENATGTIPGDDFDSGMNKPDPDDENGDGEDPEDPTEPEEPEIPETQWPATMVSGTLPVMYINTIDNQPIVSKEDYIDATYWIDPMETDFESVGAADDQKKTEIRGRGNYTWRDFDKKPYKIKLEKKTALLGMPKSKHWALLANCESISYLSTEVGFLLSRLFGLAWTPSQQPIEVVLNNEYIGLYTLCETIRVEETRVNIHEQADYETDPAEVEGAWLMELENNWTPDDPNMFYIKEREGLNIFFTPDTPEKLSAEQMEYIKGEMTYLNSLIYAEDKTDSSELESILDFDALARYYLVQELLDEDESFSGSCYFYKDAGEGKKWIFGPIWDMGNALNRTPTNKEFNRLFENVSYKHHWIPEIIKFPRFREAAMLAYDEFISNHTFEEIQNTLEEYYSTFDAVYLGANKERWPQYYLGYPSHKNWMFNNFKHNFDLVNAWYRTLPEFYVYAKVETPAVLSDANGEENTENDWYKIGTFVGQPDCTYIAQVPNLPTEFKITSEDGSFILGISEDGKLIDNDASHAIEEGKDASFHTSIIYETSTLTYDPARKTLSFYGSNSSGIISSENNSTPAFSISGNIVTASSNTFVYDVAGMTVAKLSEGQTAELPRGVYIVKANSAVSKIIVK